MIEMERDDLRLYAEQADVTFDEVVTARKLQLRCMGV